MEPNRTDRILDEWSSVARSATPPGPPPRGASTSVAGAGISLAGAAVLVVALVAVFAVLGNRPSQTSPGALPSASPSPSVAFVSPEPATPVPATATPELFTPTPEPATPTPSLLADCNAADLATQITLWEGAAGSRIGHVQLTNNGSGTCSTPDTWQPTLVDGTGATLIEGHPSTTATRITLPAGQTVTTLVLVSNYCGPTPSAPVSLSFVVDGATLTAAPETANDTTTPPCNGPGQPGSIEMQPWRS
jgi:hypothetical protein